MAQLIVRNIEAAVVRQLKRNAAEHGRSAEEEHREILRNALSSHHSKKPDLKALLEGMPAGEAELFTRPLDFGRPAEL